MEVTNHTETSSPSDDVEEIPTDPAERKRVLNVLAQRRYRRRKKQRQVVLETLVGQNVPTGTHSSRRSVAASEAVSLSATSEQIGAPQAIAFPPIAFDPSNQAVITDPAPQWDDSLDSWLTLSLDSSTSSGNGSSNPASLSEFLQEDDVEHCSFSDDFNLAVTELGLLRAGFENASRLNSAERLFDLSATSIFLDSDASDWLVTLPINLQPTKKQLTLPHHPIIDILPWPSVRNKLIDVYTMPMDYWPRHPTDGEHCSLVRLVYDMEDGGVRVWGGDPAAQEAWEVNDDFTKAWWWMLDPKVLRHTNQRRTARGEQPLRQIEASKN